ncbi:unnamed protein product [Amoebophrya sp. A120]|nr:unnamed protein product [Amoebophrya sp. A120]|eukprot:GSA120T00010855001.1
MEPRHTVPQEKALVAPAEILADGQTVYNLYRGIVCNIVKTSGKEILSRIWVDLSHMQVCVAKLDESFIARFDVHDLVVRPQGAALHQKSPEVSPEDASVDLAEILLEEEEAEQSPGSHSLVFWASNEYFENNTRNAERQRFFAELGTSRVHKESGHHPTDSSSARERRTIVVHILPPTQLQLLSEQWDESLEKASIALHRDATTSVKKDSVTNSDSKNSSQVIDSPAEDGNPDVVVDPPTILDSAASPYSPTKLALTPATPPIGVGKMKPGGGPPAVVKRDESMASTEAESMIKPTATALATNSTAGGAVSSTAKMVKDHDAEEESLERTRSYVLQAAAAATREDDVVSSGTGANPPTLPTFVNNIRKLRGLVDTDQHAILHLQRNMFQYLWRFNAAAMTPDQLFSAQAVLAFNLDPKDGIAYLKDKVLRQSDVEPRRVGEWIADMSAAGKGGIDPSILGRFFSRKDSLDIYVGFVEAVDFRGLSIVQAMRKLFDCFKPGGEGQVIDRIINHFSESYYRQTKLPVDPDRPPTLPNTTDNFPEWKSADSPYGFGFAIIMLNTDLHVMGRMIGNKAKSSNDKGFSGMSVSQFIVNSRTILQPEEASDQFLTNVYEDIKASEIQLRPLPQAPLSSLPVAPDIEGWLTVLLQVNPRGVHIQRYWCVLAIQRLYIFSDKYHGLGLYPRLCLDVKAIRANTVSDPESFQALLTQIVENQQPRRRAAFSKCLQSSCLREGTGDRSIEKSASLVCNSSEFRQYELSSDLAIVLTKDKGATQDLDLYFRPTSSEELKEQSSFSQSWAVRRASHMLSSATASSASQKQAYTSQQPEGSWEPRQPRQKRFVCCAETPNLMNKWVSMLSM